jgi:hypothetical protein
MGTVRTPSPVKLFAALLYAPSCGSGPVLDTLSREFGAVEDSFGPVPFTFSDYYREEMGDGLLKEYLLFGPLFDRERLPAVKLRTNEIERLHAKGGNRTVNIDPGYLALDKLVLATTKDFFHRLCCGKGIYAEVTLHFSRGRFRYFSWTYPDYREPEFQRFLERGRASLEKQHTRCSERAVEESAGCTGPR